MSDLSDDSVVKTIGLFSGGSDPTSGQKRQIFGDGKGKNFTVMVIMFYITLNFSYEYA